MTADAPQGEYLELVPKAVQAETVIAPQRRVYQSGEGSAAPASAAPPHQASAPQAQISSLRPVANGESAQTAPASAAVDPALARAKVLTPAKVPSWRASSYDLMTGLTVRDVTDTIPGDIFDELFKPTPDDRFPGGGKRRF